MLHSRPMPLTIFCDFDGAVVPYDIEFEIYARFGGPDKAGAVVARWERGELTARERAEQGFARLHVSRAALEDFLDEVPIDPTFPSFVRFCKDHDLPLTILSDGLVWYIQRILDGTGLAACPSSPTKSLSPTRPTFRRPGSRSRSSTVTATPAGSAAAASGTSSASTRSRASKWC